MKIHNGFVSNSSSSSFVIHRSYLTDKQVEEMEELYNKLSHNEVLDHGDGHIYDDNGTYFTKKKNYVQFTAYGRPQKWDEFIENLNLPEGAIFSNYQ